MPPAFSRLQLAAALIEYDNDPSNPDAPYRSAHDSAIFAPLRRLKPVRPEPTTRNSYLSVTLPSDTASLAPRQSVAMESRRSRASVSALRNMFGHEHEDEDEGSDAVDDAEEDLDMDLASWGIDNLLSKETTAKGKQKAPELPNPHPKERPVSVMTRNVTAQRRPANTRTRSLGDFDQFLNETSLERDNTRLSERYRRASIGSPLDLVGMEQPKEPFTHPTDQAQPHEDGRTVPFPSYGDVDPAGRSVSQLAHYRTQSTASMGSRMLANPKPRTYSTASMGTATPDDNPFALRPPSVISRFDPKSHGRTMSTASMGTHMMLDGDDGRSMMTSRPPFNRASTTLELLRPKVLVMPSPLQPPAQQSHIDVRTTEGFEVSIGGTPLPPGARTARKSSYFGTGSAAPDAANLFTPNPRLNMTLSQLTFRNNLMVGGQRDVTYADIDGGLSRATEDGQQIEMPAEEEEPEPEPDRGEEEEPHNKPYRPAGKLYGKSLIDDLEMRKANMRNKQRVFTGDQRPSMMERGTLQRSSTFIDPASLKIHPEMQRMSSFGIQSAADPRRHSTLKPLLNFDSQEHLPPTAGKPMPTSRSVFGVDVIWERETAKLKEIEAREREEEERLRKEEEENPKPKKKKGKGRDKASPTVSPNPAQLSQNVTEPVPARVSMAPPVLPAIQKASTRPPPRADDSRDDVESDESADEAKQPSRRKPSTETKRWFAGDSDEESTPPKVTPVKTTGTGPRLQQIPVNRGNGSDSEEDVPLAATVSRAVERQRNTAFLGPDDDSDEDKPLNALLEDKSKLSTLSINFDRPSPQQSKGDDDDDDDDAPLGLRASRFVPPPGQSRDEDDDDDKPLAFHPEQQRRTQFIAAQQQQQMMMQMQMQNSMFFPPAPPSMMGFPPPMMMPQLPPMPVPSPPPMQDPAKFGRVDRWRHDVAVEGER